MGKWTINRFRKAEAEYVRLRDSWYEMTQQQREETGETGLVEAKQAATMTAMRVIDEAAHRHTIEESAKVYLVLGKNGWEIDQAMMVDANVEGQENGPSNDECEHAKGLDDECTALRDAAALIDLPTGPELAALMNDRRYDLAVPD